VERKPDDRAIGAFFDELAGQPWLGRQRQFWPRFFFHITEVQNAAAILASGRLVCRARALAEQRMISDNASAEILSQSPPWLFDFVRLYFRPRTPTFYRNEGIRPRGLRDLDAHCPMPVAFMFDSISIAGRTGVQFSDGNLANHASRHGQDISFLRSLNFRDIYHEGRMDPLDNSRLTSRRQAEVIVPGELGFESLRHVATRSEAERETLLTLLQDSGEIIAPPEISVDPAVFFGTWTYVERATHMGGDVRFLFNPDTPNAVLFDAEFEWSDPPQETSTRTASSIRALGHVTVPIPACFQGRAVRLKVHLDGALAFFAMLAPIPSATIIEPR
jgi:hypothetical protein